MMFRNSFKLLLSNFNLVWKILVYQLIVFAITFSLAATVAMPLVNALQNNGFWSVVQAEYQNIAMNFNIASILNSVNEVINSFLEILRDANGSVVTSFILSAFILVLLGSFLYGLSRLAVAEVLNGYMSSHANYSFTSSLVKTLKKSTLLQFVMLIINLPITILILFASYSILPLLTSSVGLVSFLAPFTIVIAITMLFALNLTMFSGLVPAIVIHDECILKSYKIGFKAVKRRFFKTLSTSFVLILTILCVNLFFFALTNGVSFLITLPSSIILLAIFRMVMYYGSNGMRYYVDPETILSPKKLEEQDKMNKIKFII